MGGISNVDLLDGTIGAQNSHLPDDKQVRLTAPWRDWLAIHPAAELFAPLDAKDLDALAGDIKQHSLRTPVSIIKSESGFILVDGRNRLDALALLGRKIEINDSRIFQHLSADIDVYAYVISANIHRRHLTGEDKQRLTAELLKANPEKSNRQIAATVKVDHKTVGTVRSEMEGRGEIPHVDKRTDTKGRKQPAKAPHKKKPSPEADMDDGLPDHPENQEEKKSSCKCGLTNPLIAAWDAFTAAWNAAPPEEWKGFLAARKLHIPHLMEHLAAACEQYQQQCCDDDGLDIPASLRRTPKEGAAP
jgi:hypothetical protein